MGFSIVLRGKPIVKNNLIHTSYREANGKYAVEFLITPENKGQYDTDLCLNVFGDKIDMILNTQNGWVSTLDPNKLYDFHVNLASRAYTKDGKTSYFNSFNVWKVEPVMASTGALPPAPQGMPPTSTAPTHQAPPTYQGGVQAPAQVSAPMPTAAPQVTPPARPAIPTVPQGCTAAQLHQGFYWTQTATGVQMYYDANTNTWITPQQPAAQGGNNSAGGVDDLPF